LFCNLYFRLTFAYKLVINGYCSRLYLSDLDLITQIIQSQFNSSLPKDKSEILKTNLLGYRSIHFIVTVKNEWLEPPDKKKLRGLKAEIQLRTVSMHAWAATEHGLGYKPNSYISEEIRRSLNLLAGHFEIADHYLEIIKKQQETELELIKNLAKKEHPFDENSDLNHKNIWILLTKFFPSEHIMSQNVENIRERLTKEHTDITMKELMDLLEKNKDILLSPNSTLGKDRDFNLVDFILGIVTNFISIKTKSAKHLDSPLEFSSHLTSQVVFNLVQKYLLNDNNITTPLSPDKFTNFLVTKKDNSRIGIHAHHLNPLAKHLTSLLTNLLNTAKNEMATGAIPVYD